MGELDVDRLDPVELRHFTRKLLHDVQVLERMLSAGVLESGKQRVGCEQEMFLVDRAWRPLPAAVDVLRVMDDPHFTTELGLFNLEVNLDCVSFEGDCLSRMEADLVSKLKRVRSVAQEMGGDIVLTGILPSIRKSDLGLENLTPMRRYEALNQALKELRGDDYEFRLKGLDELAVTEDSVMLEACCTSFQVHYQTDPEDFARMYNIAQAVTGPLLAAAANSPMLFGRRLWLETRVPLFQQSLDTRSASSSLRERSPRVGFGERWLDDSVLELFREDIARFRVLLGSTAREDSVAMFRRGDIPRLKALQVHSGTVYRWNRGCYGLTDGRPHLRIENRVLPAGPTVLDEISNAAFFFGLMRGMPAKYPDIRRCMDFDDAELNFMSAAQSGLRAQFRWMGRGNLLARDLILEELLPLAREGLDGAGISKQDVARYLGVIEARVTAHRTGSQWILESFADMKEERRSAALTAVTAATVERQWSGKAGHEWPPARVEEGRAMDRSQLRVEETMSTDLFTIHPDEPMDLVTSLMDWKHVRHVPVEDESGRLVGLVSIVEVLRYINGRDPNEKEPTEVRAIMDPQPVTLAPEASLARGISLMMREDTDCLLVVKDDRLVGILTDRDILNLAGELLTVQGDEG